MSIVREICGINTKIIKSRTRTMKIKVYIDSIRVSIPNNMSYYTQYNDIVKFVSDNIEWIKEEQKRVIEENKFPVHEYKDGEEVYLFGEKYTLCVKEGKSESFVSDDKIILTLKDTDKEYKRYELLNALYRKKLKEKLDELMPAWEEKTGLFSNEVSVKYMSASWGRCSYKVRNISFSSELAKVPVECLEYVILHELSHIAVPNHGKDFQALLDKYMPDWRDVSNRLDYEYIYMR